MTTPEIRPASDAIVDAFISDWPNEDRTEADGIEVDAGDLRALLARIEADRAENAKLRARVAELEVALSEVRESIPSLTSDTDPRSWADVRRLEREAYALIDKALGPEPASR